MGFAYQKTGQSKIAIATYYRFLRRNPNDVQSHVNLAYELKAENNCNSAVVHFNKVIELRPSYREAHLHLSRCYRVLGDELLSEKHRGIFAKES